MYLDTKNLTAINMTTAMGTVEPKATRRMRKVWQPLRKLLTVGGKSRPTAQPHPNNVDLNNTQQVTLLPPLELLHSIDDDNVSKSTPEESITKFAERVQLQLQQEELAQTPPPPNTPTLISSVYVEKASTQSCNACQHGRNCQHKHHSNNNSNNSNSNSSSNDSTLWDLQLPLQYISTDNGTFFWANTQERVDDDLLHAWLCQSFSQLPGTLC